MGARLALAAGLGLLVALVATPAAAQSDEVETLGTRGSVTLEVRKGRVIRLPRPAATVFVADPEIADVQAQSPTVVYLFGRRAGSTSLYAVGDGDELLVRTQVEVLHNLSGLRAAIRQLLPDSEVTVSTVDGSIVLDGAVVTPTEMQNLRELAARFLGDEESLLNRVRVASPTQVHLRVKVAEVSREVIKEFGINWQALFNSGEFLFGIAQGRQVATDPGALVSGAENLNDPNIDLVRRNFLRSPTGANSVFGSFLNDNADVSTALDALAQEGLVNVLAEPNLTALSGETATFLAGGEFPIPVSADDDEIEIEFKEFGISLAFTPTVLSGSRISLRVRPEVSELTDEGAITIQGLRIPALATRRAETTVELGSGQSFMIGGLLSSNVQNAVRKFPGLGDLPVLGTLFRSQSFQRNETEVVIAVTPYLVRPVSEQRVALPTDGYQAPSDLERILEGRLHSARLQPGKGGPVGAGGQRLMGPMGFVLD